MQKIRFILLLRTVPGHIEFHGFLDHDFVRGNETFSKPMEILAPPGVTPT